MKRAVMVSIVCAVVGLLTCLAGLFVDASRTFFAYLQAFVFFATVAIGALLWLMVDHASKAAWTVVTRRITEAVAGTLPALAVLVVPIFFGLKHLYPWAMPHDLFDEETAAKLDHRSPFLNPAFFVIRQIVYFALFVGTWQLLRRWSVKNDEAPSLDLVHRMRKLSAGGLVVIGLAQSWAGYDWVMSLEADWWSTMWGFYFFAGGFVGAIGLVSVLLWLAHRNGPLAGVVTPAHGHAIGRVLFAMVIFWAYTAFGQLLIIWLPDIPTDVRFYEHRIEGSWSGVTYFVAFVHFIVPFFVLLSKEVKRRLPQLAFWGGWVVFAHYVDVYWMVLPMHDHWALQPHWLDLGALLLVGGATTAVGLLRYGAAAPLPEHDPELLEGLRYEAHIQ